MGKPTGIELIAAERTDQIEIHGFDRGHDAKPGHGCGELVAAAVYLLSKVPRGDRLGAYPSTWNKAFKKKFDNKNRMEKLVVAGALIAAEIDRLNAPLRCPRCSSGDGLNVKIGQQPHCDDCGWPDSNR